MSENPRKAAEETQSSRYVVGIDLGTTNSAMTFVDTASDPWKVRVCPVPQLVAAGLVETRETLPSFHYEAAADEFPPTALDLPWQKISPIATGVFAREQGRLVPGRVIDSAKSWLCHTGVDRTTDLLPWHGASDIPRLSPVEVSARYLGHLRAAWDARFSQDPLSEQDVVLTLPASFDEVARELTIQAARQAGLPRVVLIEEPQAAFYAWIDAHRESWEDLVSPGQKILVCDIGGGTSDFTLIRVRRGEGGKIQFHRVAVGDHLILGGDNLDLAIAHHLEKKLKGEGKLEPRQWSVLVQSCRHVKETLLGQNAPDQLTVNLPGSGSRLIGGGLQVEAIREEILEVLLEGFLPKVALEDKPQVRSSGFQEFGLPYATDPAITRYLAAFLSAHRHVTVGDEELPTDHDPARPDIVLFNGGFFASEILRHRLLDILGSWFPSEDPPPWEPHVLRNDRLDLAVSQGASYYGMVRRGQGVRIAAGLARTYYIGVAGTDTQALCLMPASSEPGKDLEIREQQFSLRVSEPIEFPLYVSSTRLTDRAGELVPIDPEQMKALPPLRTVLKTRKKNAAEQVAIFLNARLTEIGTLELRCQESKGNRSWRLQFDIRSATQTDIAAHESAAEGEGVLAEEDWQTTLTIIEGVFGIQGKEKPSALAKRIAKAIDINRTEWPSTLLRNMWEALADREDSRRRTADHEARWLNLLGFSLRPGYGLALDDWRVAETWKMLNGKLVHGVSNCKAEWWILWRRIGGGLVAGQQTALASPLIAPIRQLHKQITTGRGKGGIGLTSNTHEQAEIWRMLGSLERLNLATKQDLGRMILDLYGRPKFEAVRPAMIWALARLGARKPLYGPLNAVIPAQEAERWVVRLMEDAFDDPMLPLAVMQIARRTDDRFRDLPEETRNRCLDWLDLQHAPAHFQSLIQTAGNLEAEEQSLIFGEALPKGLQIV